MNLHMGRNFAIPPVSIAAVFYLAVALSVPVYDLLVARAARRVTKTKGGGIGITLLQRQGAGLAVGTLAFMVAAAVERRRRRSALALGDGASSPLPVFLLAPQLAVMGVPGALSMVGQTEFYNTQFPDQMRTLANGAFYCAQDVSSYLATLVVSVVNAATRRCGGPAGWVTDDIKTPGGSTTSATPWPCSPRPTSSTSSSCARTSTGTRESRLPTPLPLPDLSLHETVVAQATATPRSSKLSKTEPCMLKK